MAKHPIYVVFKGKKPGIYTTWQDCADQVNGVSGAVHYKYDTMEEAELKWSEYIGKASVSKEQAPPHKNEPISTLYVCIGIVLIGFIGVVIGRSL